MSMKSGSSGHDYAEGESEREKRKTLSYMVQTSAFHGVGKIWSAPNKLMKFLWLLSLLVMAGAMTYQLIRLTQTFFSLPVKTSVSLAFSPLQLPAITFCNTNPIRLSQIHKLKCDLQAALKVDDKFKSPECVNTTYQLNKNLTDLCDKYYWFCTGNASEDVDDFAARKKRVQLEIVKEDRQTIEDVGHQIEDMVVSCSFQGLLCNIRRHFFRDWNMEYGNCYTLNTSTMSVFDSGPPSGLDMVFNLEVEESLQSFKTGYGIRVVVHEPGTRPFPSSDGMTISAGVETHFGIRMEEVARLGGRYGDCRYETNDLYTPPYSKYSIKACRNLCLEQSEINACGCTDPLARVATPTKGAKLCFTKSEFTCTARIRQEFIDTISRGDSYCSCGNPCRESVYLIRASSRKWPIYSYLPVLEREICKRYENESELVACMEDRAQMTLEERESTFLRLRVYFETLNYEQIKEEPFYDAERFLSDIGGTLGLWIGASLLGLGEVVEIFIFALLKLFRRIRGNGFFLWSRSGNDSPDRGNNNNRRHTHTQGSMGSSVSEKVSSVDLTEISA